MTARRVLLLLAVLAPAAAACSDPAAQNPDKLWLALMGSERAVQLVGEEPDPF